MGYLLSVTAFTAALRAPVEAAVPGSVEWTESRMRRTVSLLASLFLMQAAASAAELRTLDVFVTRIIDGDTLVAIDSNRLEHRVRLAGIDAPERGQPFGERSRQNLATLAHNQSLRLEWSKVDRYGRLVATILLAQGCPGASCAQLDINLAQIQGGFAWHYVAFQAEQTEPTRREYAAAEQTARAGGLGLWVDLEPVAPWNWRAGPATAAVKESRAGICHDTTMASYRTVRHFEGYADLEGCLASGGRLPKSHAR
jgi:endonuclease YncB( thermonuclease family)